MRYRDIRRIEAPQHAEHYLLSAERRHEYRMPDVTILFSPEITTSLLQTDAYPPSVHGI